jgi:hypothetical protein
MVPTYYGAARRMASPSSRRVKKSWSSTEASDGLLLVNAANTEEGREVGVVPAEQPLPVGSASDVRSAEARTYWRWGNSPQMIWSGWTSTAGLKYLHAQFISTPRPPYCPGISWKVRYGMNGDPPHLL